MQYLVQFMQRLEQFMQDLGSITPVALLCLL
jgi:hypothetical protein